MYSPLWKITHHNPSVLCTPPFEKALFLMNAYFGMGVYLGKYGFLLAWIAFDKPSSFLNALWTSMGSRKYEFQNTNLIVMVRTGIHCEPPWIDL